MSTTATAAAEAAGAPEGQGTSRRSRRPRRSTVLVVVVVLATLVVAALGTRSATRAAPLDPNNPEGAGAQALARVLDDEGVEVDVVRDADALAGAEVDADTTVVVTSTTDLGPSTLQRLLDDAADGQVVLVSPGSLVLDELDVTGLPVPADGVAADCGTIGTAGDGADLSGLDLGADLAFAYDLPGCFAVADGDGAVLGEVRPGLLLLGADAVLSNEQVTRDDNAAVALRLLGATDRLVWYVPDPADVATDEAVGVGDLLPPWLAPSLWLLFGTSLVAIWWRARRFGPLATEPLPVAVKASETTRSRGRLYHRARDRDHATAALRTATRHRVAVRLGAPATPASDGADPLLAEVASRTGRHPDDVGRLLSPRSPAPTDDAGLIALAEALATLEEEVRRT